MLLEKLAGQFVEILRGDQVEPERESGVAAEGSGQLFGGDFRGWQGTGFPDATRKGRPRQSRIRWRGKDRAMVLLIARGSIRPAGRLCWRAKRLIELVLGQLAKLDQMLSQTRARPEECSGLC